MTTPRILQIYRPVLNIGDEQLKDLEQNLKREGQFPVKDIMRLFRVRELRSQMLLTREVEAAANKADHEDRFAIKSLYEYMQGNLPKSMDEPLRVPTLPAGIYDPGVKGRRELHIAFSKEVTAERIASLELLSNFFELDPPSQTTQRESLAISAPILANAQNVQMRPLLSHLRDSLESYGIPEFTEFGPAFVRVR